MRHKEHFKNLYNSLMVIFNKYTIQDKKGKKEKGLRKARIKKEINQLFINEKDRENIVTIKENNYSKKSNSPVTLFNQERIERFLNWAVKHGVLREENSLYFLSEDFKYEYLRLLQKDIIMETPAQNVLATRNTMYYFSNILYSDITPSDYLDIRTSEFNFYRNMNSIMVNIKNRKLSSTWQRKLIEDNNIPVSLRNSNVKLYIWLYTIFLFLQFYSKKYFYSHIPLFDTIKTQDGDIKREEFGDYFNKRIRDFSSHVYQCLLQGYYPSLTRQQILNICDSLNTASSDHLDYINNLLDELGEIMVKGHDFSLFSTNISPLQERPTIYPLQKKYKDDIINALDIIDKKEENMGLITTLETEVYGKKIMGRGFDLNHVEKSVDKKSKKKISFRENILSIIPDSLREKIWHEFISLSEELEMATPEVLIKRVDYLMKVFAMPKIPTKIDTLIID